LLNFHYRISTHGPAGKLGFIRGGRREKGGKVVQGNLCICISEGPREVANTRPQGGRKVKKWLSWVSPWDEESKIWPPIA